LVHASQVLSKNVFEVSLIGPVDGPGVGNDPVGHGSSLVPSNNSDTMSSDLSSRGLVVNTIGLSSKEAEEVFINSETGFDGSVGLDLELHGLDGGGDGAVGTGGVLSVGGSVSA